MDDLGVHLFQETTIYYRTALVVRRLRLSLPNIPSFESQVCCLKTCVHWDMVGTCYPCLRLTAQPWMFDDVCISFAHGFRMGLGVSPRLRDRKHLSTGEIWEANPITVCDFEGTLTSSRAHRRNSACKVRPKVSHNHRH